MSTRNKPEAAAADHRPSPELPVLRFDLEQIREILPQLIDALSDAVAVVSSERRVVAVNRRYLESFGRRQPDLIGTRCTEALHCPERAAVEDGRCAACDTFDSGVAQRRIRNLPDATGAMRRWEATFSPVVGSGDGVTHVVEVWRDITDRSQLEAQLSHSERLASLGILAAGVGHELNNPLASVLAGVESLDRWLGRADFGADAVAEAAEVLEVLERETRRCRETTDKLMLLAQPYSVAAAWVDLNQVVLDTLSLLRFQLRRQGVEVADELDPGLPQIWAKSGAMRGVCMNLMMNAIQAMTSGGTLTVRTSSQGAHILLDIIDTGTGIAPEHLDRIWDPFFTTKPVGHGTGLGLSITHRLITRHGGTIDVRSEPGAGATFRIVLPVNGPGGSGV